MAEELKDEGLTFNSIDELYAKMVEYQSKGLEIPKALTEEYLYWLYTGHVHGEKKEGDAE